MYTKRHFMQQYSSLSKARRFSQKSAVIKQSLFSTAYKIKEMNKWKSVAIEVKLTSKFLLLLDGFYFRSLVFDFTRVSERTVFSSLIIKEVSTNILFQKFGIIQTKGMQERTDDCLNMMFDLNLPFLWWRNLKKWIQF